MGSGLAGPRHGEDCVLAADLDLDEMPEGKYDLDVAGHYARPDIFELRGNERPLKPVKPAEDTPAPKKT